MTVRIFPLIVNVVSDIIGSLRILSYIYVTLGYEIKCNYDIFASQKLWVFQETSFRYDYKVFFCWNTFFFPVFSKFFCSIKDPRFSTYAEFSEKRTCVYQEEKGRKILLPDMDTYVCLSAGGKVGNISSSKNFADIPNRLTD